MQGRTNYAWHCLKAEMAVEYREVANVKLCTLGRNRF